MNATVSFLSPRKFPTTQSASAAAAVERPNIRVPASAVRDGAVFVVENGKAIKRTVAVIKDAGGREVQVQKGLIGGEDLIVSPPESLEDGAKVTVADTKS